MGDGAPDYVAGFPGFGCGDNWLKSWMPLPAPPVQP